MAYLSFISSEILSIYSIESILPQKLHKQEKIKSTLHKNKVRCALKFGLKNKSHFSCYTNAQIFMYWSNSSINK